MVLNLLRRLSRHEDLELSVVLLNGGKLAEELKASGLAVTIVDEKRHSFPQLIRRVREVAGACNPAVIHSHRYKENILALLARPSPAVRLVSTQHGLPEFMTSRGMIIQRLTMKLNLLVLSRFFTTVAVSDDIRRTLVEHLGFRGEKVRVVHNGIELPAVPTRRENPMPFVIGSSGRIFPVKDFPLMVDAARAMKSCKGSGIRFELAGDGPGRSALEERIRNRGVSDCFVLKGHQQDMARFYGGLNLYMNTSMHEGIPMTILEALAHGLPVVAAAVGGIVEILEDGKEGFLIDGRDPRRFADRCLLLMNDPEEYRRMARNARARAERLSAGRMAALYHAIYTEPRPPDPISSDLFPQGVPT
jgi:glycosyltransferase involved in cell wall biosynthesis